MSAQKLQVSGVCCACCSVLLLCPLLVMSACPCGHQLPALKELYAATNGPSWTKPWDMTDVDAPCNWAGITCITSDGGVRYVNLQGFGLSGTLPENLSAMTSLRVLLLADNSISGTLPGSYARSLVNLTHFDVSRNKLSGTLPVVYAAWAHLQIFAAAYNVLSGSLPVDYSSWSDMRFFWLDDNMLTGTLPPQYAYWSSITHFSIDKNTFSGTLPPEFGGWAHIEIVHAAKNSISGTLPHGLSAWNALREFTADSNLLSGTLPSAYSNWTRIRTFDVSSNSITGTLPSEYSSWTNISRFSVGRNSLGGTLPPQCSVWGAMEVFAADSNVFSGTLPASYANWTQLTNLELANNSCSGTLPQTYNRWTRMRSFDVSMNSITGTLPEAYSSWARIDRFMMEFNQIRGTLPSAYSNWTNVSMFSVRSNVLSGTLPAAYSAWRKLREFLVSHNNISGTLPAEFGQELLLLRRFLASNNSIRGTLPPTYYQWRSLQQFGVSHNQLSSTLPVDYRSWVSITVIELGYSTLTGTLPPEYSSFVALRSFTAEGNRIAGSLPAQYSAWVSVDTLALFGNSLTGTIPPSWGSMRELTTIVLSNNQLTGTIPPTILTFPRLQIFSVAYNNLSGTLPGSTTATALLLQNNTGLHGRLPSVSILPNMFSICGTGITCPVVFLSLSICAANDGPALYKVTANEISALPLFNCVNSPPNPDEPTRTQPVPAPDEIAFNDSPFHTYLPVFAPTEGLLATASLVDPVTGLSLAALGAGRCAPGALKGSTSTARVLLSPFYALGPAASVLGNVGVALAIAACHYGAVRVLQWRKRASHTDRQLTAAMVQARFPGYSATLALHLSRGVAFYGGQALLDDDDPIGLRVFACLAAVAALAGVVGTVVALERRGILRRALRFEKHRMRALRRVAWAPVWLLPVGRWGPEDARKQLGVFRNSVAGGRERVAMLTHAVSVAMALVVGSVPGSAAGCVGQAVAQCLVLGGAVVCVVLLRPMRVPAGGWLLCATWACEACMLASIAVGRASESSGAAVDAVSALSIIQICLSVCRTAHRLFLWWWERGCPLKAAVAANDAPALQTGPLTTPQHAPTPGHTKLHRTSPREAPLAAHDALRELLEMCVESVQIHGRPSRGQAASDLL